MFLKSVKARGFKSFARPVEFAFEPGITVVVGPNGSGKSNISDCVTWAMGEQSPSAVRGNSMQDIIFSGSDKLAPAGMAEVELLLDNSSGLLPIEFSEVLISRRLYRDGDGSYFINRSACRLIDVVELLSDAGLGKNTHSIISQGRVDAILESKPAERRAYIEEAAGLGKYKKRRQRAERKLVTVRRNLERLTDVEEELKTNLRPLKRQATAAERSAKLDQQIAALETQLYLGRLELASVDLKAAQEAAQQAGRRRVQLEEQLAATAQERSQTEESLAASLKEHQQLAERFYNLKTHQDSLAQRQEAIQQRRQVIVQGRRRAEGRRENLRGQIEQARAELARAQAEHRQDLARLRDVETELEAEQSRLGQVEAEIYQRRQAGEERRRHIAEQTALRDRHRHQIGYLEQRTQELINQAERSEEESQQRRQRLEELERQAEEARRAMQRWAEQIGGVSDRLQQLNQERDSLESQRSETVSRLRRMEEDLKIIAARLAFIEESAKDRSGLPQAAKELSRQHDLKALVDIIEVEPGYERAVSALLGSALFALAAQDLDHAGSLLESAQAAQLGSVEFALPGEAAPRSESGGDYLIDHVTLALQWSPFLSAQLAGVRVIDAAAGLPPADSDWVTREGVVYRAGRRLLSFKSDVPSSVVLQQRNERRQLHSQLQEAQKLRLSLQRQVAAFDEQMDQLKQQRRQAQEQLDQLHKDQRSAESDSAALDRRQQGLKQEIELAAGRLHHLQEERQKLAGELEQSHRQQAEAEAALAELEATTGVYADDEALAAQRQSLSAKVTELQIAAARLRERERVAEEAMRRAGPARERWQQELRTVAFQLAAFDLIEPLYESLLQATQSVGGRFAGLSGALAAELKQKEELADQRSASLRRLSQAEAELQQQLSQASDATTGCEVKVTKLGDQVEELNAHLAQLQERFPDDNLQSQAAAAAGELIELEGAVQRLIKRRELIGPVNPLAQQEYEELEQRQHFLTEQRADLEQSLNELAGLIKELTDRIETSFGTTFEAVRQHFSDVVATLFPGGKGRLSLTLPEAASGEEEEPDTEEEPLAGVEKGIEISVKPARKALRNLSLLSGGERSLVAIAFLFAIFLAKPAPFYILDEVEAALDDVNIDRLLGMLKRYQTRTQFIVITHQKKTMEVADVIYGVSMGADGTSKVLSRRMSKDGPDASSEPESQESPGTAPAALAG